MNMKRSRESKRVSWASDPTLCQVKLFVREDCPSQISSKFQNYRQGKTSMLSSNIKRSDDVPPGFGSTHHATPSKGTASRIPLIRWKCPPQFIINGMWQVTAGEESEEKHNQKLREMKVFEAFYLHRSAIPQCPSASWDVEAENYDDSETPTIRLIPIEEEQESTIASSSMTSQTKAFPEPPKQAMSQCGTICEAPEISRHKSGPGGETAPGKTMGADVMAAASAVLTALTKSKEPGSLIDADLLVKILSDPGLVKKLINDQNAPQKSEVAQTVVTSIPTACPNASLPSTLMPTNVTLPELSASTFQSDKISMTGVKRTEPSSSSSSSTLPVMFTSGQKNGKPHHAVMSLQPHSSAIPQPNHAQMSGPLVSATTLPISATPIPPVFAGPKPEPPMKDPNYIKNLIREHGMAKSGTPENQQFQQTNTLSHVKTVNGVRNVKRREIKAKIQKPCMYFNSSRGCKLGVNCLYLHDQSSLQWRTGSAMAAPSSKRMKLGGEIAGG